MKKTILRLFSACLVLALTLTCLPAPARADTLQDGNFYYEVYEGMAGIVGYEPDSVGQTLVIPDTLGGYPVRAIVPYCFDSCSQITTLVLPDTLFAIDDYAFFGCDGLTEVVLPSSLMYLGQGAFAYCSNLTDLQVSNWLYMPSDTFYGSDNLQYNAYQGGLYLGDETNPYRILMEVTASNIDEFSLHPQVQTIGYRAFAYREDLTQITLPETLCIICDNAFYYTGLTRLDLPDSLLGIGAMAFMACTQLTEITVGKGLMITLEDAFGETYQLERFVVDPENSYFCSDDRGVLFNKDKTLLVQAPAKLSGSYEVPQGVQQIGNDGFSSCSELTAVTLPEGLVSIGNDGFSGCNALTAVTLPDSVRSLGDRAFMDCHRLTTLTIGKGLETVGFWLTGYCYRLEAFVVDPENRHFSSGSRGELLSKDQTLLYQVPLALSGSYTVPQTVTTIKLMALDGCWQITQIHLPEGLKTIERNAFCGCTGLTSLALPDSVTSIGDRAFGECYALETLHFGKGLETLGEDIIDDCDKLTAFSVDPENPNFYNDDRGVLFLKKPVVLLYAPKALSGSYTAPEGVREIGQFAFADCLNLTDVTFQEGLEIIQNQALSYCASLTTVTLPRSLTQVDYDVYWSSEQLRDIYYNGTQYRYESIAFDHEEDRYPEGVTVHYLSIALPYDFNEDDQVTDADAIYLLRYTLFPENYPLNSSGDANHDGDTTDADAIYLLRHTLFPESYPLN